MKGQISLVNLIMIFVTIIAYFILLPVLSAISDETVTTLQAAPNTYTSLIVTLIYILPFFILLAIVITIFNYAIPTQEGRR
jgi:hypothetical protein